MNNQTADETVHACPPPGSGLTPCCGRTPFELPLNDRIGSEAPVTCPGAVQAPAADRDAVTLVPRVPRPLDIEHDELMARAEAEHRARTEAETARKTADRAAVLREAAAQLDAAAERQDDLSSSDYDQESYAAFQLRDQATALRRMADEAHPAQPDTLPAWLHWRFGTQGQHAQTWDALTDDDRSYWEHQARAVRRAVARGGFKRRAAEALPAQPQAGEAPEGGE
ncbi:hypothetical protein [Streptomyces glaucescens]|uniref:hypothetical protein n=1 Tax=Streptomyces glaucescens TaxID=1907 RepID=UPI000A3C279E|nr:hypothetical protein [Streptomyces glaucescens]